MSINTRRASTNPEINLQTQKNALCPSERYVANAPKTMEMHFSIAISYQRCLGNKLEQMLRVSRQSKEQRKVLTPAEHMIVVSGNRGVRDFLHVLNNWREFFKTDSLMS